LSPAFIDAALAHTFFDSVRSQYPNEEILLFTGPGGLNFSFDSKAATPLTAQDFKKLIIEEGLSYKAELAVQRKLAIERRGAGAAPMAEE